ncbi:MAG: hypothetical protein ACXVCE_16600 [Bacteriovorax sp.]
MRKIFTIFCLLSITSKFSYAGNDQEAKLQSIAGSNKVQMMLAAVKDQPSCDAGSVKAKNVKSGRDASIKFSVDFVCGNGANTEDQQIVTIKGTYPVINDAQIDPSFIRIESFSRAHAPDAGE